MITTGFSDGLEVETGAFGSFPRENEGDVPAAVTADLELATVLQTQQSGNKHHTKPIADLAPPEDKLTPIVDLDNRK
jgi:hypothetical protein